MPRALIEILGDASSLRRATLESLGLNRKLEASTSELSLKARASADLQIQSSLRKDARLREEVATYRAVAASAAKGSREQVVAANLADRAQRRLAGSLGVTSHEARSLSASSRSAEREIGRATRGALAGSGIFSKFGRSLAFASGGFLAFASGGQFIRTSIDAAREALVTQRQEAAQLAVTGKAYSAYRGEIDKTTLRLSALSGFTKDKLDRAFTTILRTTGSVAKSLRDVGTAAALSRAKPNIGLDQSATIIAKVEAGNTTLLRRQGFEIGKHITSEAALAKVRQVLAGQTAAGTTASERFSAVLHDSEVIIGTGILPTLNKYLASGAKWLAQMNESGRLQKDVKADTHALAEAITVGAHAVKDAAAVFKTFSHVLGGAKQAAELLGGVFLATKFLGGFKGIAAAAGEAGAAGQVGLLTSRLRALGKVGVISVEILVAEKLVPKSFNAGSGTASALGLKKGFISRALGIPTPGEGGQPTKQLANERKQAASLIRQGGTDFPAGTTFTLTGIGDVVVLDSSGNVIASFKKGDQSANAKLAQLEARVGKRLKIPKPPVDNQGDNGARVIHLTTTQRNQFFDSRISRLLDRSQDGGLKAQIAKLQSISRLISERIAKTKDITRKLNLEDQLVSVGRTIRSDQQQLAQQVADKIKKDKADALKARQKLIDRTSAREFFTLGLGPTGDTRTPLASTLKRQLGTVSDAVKGTFLDTSKTRSELAGFRKVLSESLVPTDVRAKIRELLDGINQELKNGTTGNQTKFRHLSSDSILARLGLSPEQTRKARAVLAQIGAGGSAPGGRSQAFALAGAGAGAGVTINGDLVLHGVHDVKALKKELDKQTKRRPPSRRN